MTIAMFSATTAAQVAAFFAKKNGGSINVMKLVKLMYLADRQAMDQYGEPITYDRMVSMDNGPVLSQTLNLINGDAKQAALAQWDEWIRDRENHTVSLIREFDRSQLDQISDAEWDLLENIWVQFGAMDQWTLSTYAHNNCGEWRYPEGSSIPISEVDVFLALGRSEQEAQALAEAIRAERKIDSVFSRL